ncbi:MAG: hypothetical protein GY710_15655 [Desulfobacteraceae bacterium]|nr:hypothetical protein [Desulfobacteraceae bacterium]
MFQTLGKKRSLNNYLSIKYCNSFLEVIPILMIIAVLGFCAPVSAQSDLNETRETVTQENIDSPTEEVKDIDQKTAEDTDKEKKTEEEPAKLSAMASDSDDTDTEDAEDISTKISLPKIDASLFSGAASASIPILLPPGRAGLQPEINLTYNSYQKNGWMGMGWDITLGAIQRSTKRGVNFTANDYESVMGGGSELVSRADWGADFYGAKIEDQFTKYFYNSATKGWEATDKNGLRYFFGTTPVSRQDDPKDVTRIFKWCLDKVVDTNDNYMAISYTKDQGQIYPARVDYTGNFGLNPTNAVIFHLEDQRSDMSKQYSINFEVITAKRLATIEIKSSAGLVRAYKLEYTNSTSTFRSLLNKIQQYGNDATLDDSGTIIGGTTLPAMDISWSESENGLIFPDYTKPVLPANINGINTVGTEIAGDFNGDGKTDFLYRSYNGDGRWLIAYGTETGFTTPNYNKPALPANINGINTFGSESRFMRTGDFNGDGKTDFLYRSYNGDGRWLIAYGTETGFTTPNYNKPALPANINSINTVGTEMTGDFNGDGKTDFLYRSYNGDGRWLIAYGTETGFTIPDYNKPVLPANINKINTFGKEPGTMKSGDFNGDGKADFMYCSYNGDGRWLIAYGTETGLTIPDYDKPALPAIIDGWKTSYPNGSRYMRIGDFNGDGKTDYMYIPPNSMEWLIAYGTETGFILPDYNNPALPYSINGHTTTNPHPEYMRNGDFNGDGKTDYMYRSGNGDGRWLIAYGTETGFTTPDYNKPTLPANFNSINTVGNEITEDFNGDGKTDYLYRSYNGDGRWLIAYAPPVTPDLITKLTNGQNAQTSLAYGNSSDLSNKLLPYILHPVKSLTINDGNGINSVTSYDYEGGDFSYVTRDFRGFETVTKTNPDGTKIETKFLQGEFDKGRQYQEELRDPSKILLSKSTMEWETKLSNDPDDPWGFVKLNKTRSENYDDETTFSQGNYTYDDSNGNLLTSIKSGTGGESVTTANTYENFGSWVFRTTSTNLSGSTSGQSRYMEYDYETDTGNLLSTTLRLDGVNDPITSAIYDGFGNPVTQIDALGNLTTTDYDSDTYTFAVRITHPETNGVAHVETIPSMDYRFGKPLVTEDENGNRTFYTYDTFGRLIREDLPNGGQNTTEYNDTAFPRYMASKVKENALGSTIDTISYLDGLNRTIQTVTFGDDNKYIINQTSYDSMGREYLSQGPFYASNNTWPQEAPSTSPWARKNFDYRSRPVLIQTPDGVHGTVTATLSYSGLSTTTTDPDGASKTETRDYLDRIVKVTEHADEDFQTNYTYNVPGDLLSVTDAHGNLTIMEYDSLGRKTAIDDPDMGYWSYTYDANNNMLTQTDAKKQTTAFKYDDLNRVLSKTYSANDTGVFYTYDNLNITNGKGQLYRTTNDDVTITVNGYDSIGNLLSETKTITGAPESYTTSYTYDLAGRPVTTTYPQGFSITNIYIPGTSLLGEVTGSDGVSYAKISEYTPEGKIGLIDFPNDTYTRYTYDNLSGHLISIDTNGAGATPPVLENFYSYTPAGDIAGINDAAGNINYSYTYDKLHRLIKETNTGNTLGLSYTYNAIGNITSKTMGSNTAAYRYSGYSPHAVSSISMGGLSYAYSYDTNGNLLSGPDFSNLSQTGTRTITYNSDNMPQNIDHTLDTTTTTVSFAYGGDQQRAKKSVSNGATTFYINKYFQVKSKDTTTQFTNYIFAGNLRIAQIKGDTPYYFHKDHLGSSTVMSDAAGNKVETTKYLPYGGERSHTGTKVTDYKFTDQEKDESTGLYNYDARLYDPVTGLFIMTDTAIPNFTDLENGRVYDPQSLNRYTYCLNNPLKYIDPDGHQPSHYEFDLNVINYYKRKWENIGMHLFKKQVVPTVKKTAIITGVGVISTALLAESIPIAISNPTIVTKALTGYYFVSKNQTDILSLTTGLFNLPSDGTYSRAGAIGSVVSTSYNYLSNDFFGNAVNNNNNSYGNLGNSNYFWSSSVNRNYSRSRADNDGYFWSSSVNNNYSYRNDYSENDSDKGSGGGWSVICTELHRQGLLDQDIYEADEAFGRYLRATNLNALNGYHLWAKPVVKLMQDSELMTKTVYFFAKPWTEEMAHRMGLKEKGNFWGNILMETGLPFCTLIGLFIDFSKDIQSFNIILIFMFSGVVGFYIFRNIKYQKKRRQLKTELINNI